MHHAVRALTLPLLCLVALSAPLAAEPPRVEIKHSGPVLAVAWSADGKLVASAGEDAILRINAFPEGQEAAQLPAGSAMSGVVFSADAKFVAAKARVADGPLIVWEVATKKQLRKLGFPSYTARHLAFTPDGQTLVASDPGEHMVWNHAKGNGYGSRAGNTPAGSFAAVSPNGLIAAWCDPKGALILYYTEGRRTQHMQLGPSHA